MDSIETVVIGAGLIGLAVARALALRGREVVVLEAEDVINSGISSRNSEVIHAGIYYPGGSLKARLCVAGKQRLYDFCQSHGIPHRRPGKFIVATSGQEAEELAGIQARAAANGVDDLVPYDRSALARAEPDLNAVAALFSPSTGIVDSHALGLALQGDLEDRGGFIAFHSPVTGGRIAGGGFELTVGGASPGRLHCRQLVNAAGLESGPVAARLAGFPAGSVPRHYYAKGSYFSLAGRTPFSRLIYPVPVPGGLGIHLTLDLQGRARFGPDVEWVDRPDYEVDAGRAAGFYTAIRRYWPGLPDGALTPDYAGVRPKISGPGTAAADFHIHGPAGHGIAGLVHLFGIESPGLTASLAVAEHVADALG